MRMKSAVLGLVLLSLTVMLTGCGGSTYASSAPHAVDEMRDAINAFNSASTHDVASTGAACKTALDALKSDDTLAHPPAKGPYRQSGSALRDAYSMAVTGFSDCVRAADAMDYLGMARAGIEIGFANGWIKRARRFDR